MEAAIASLNFTNVTNSTTDDDFYPLSPKQVVVPLFFAIITCIGVAGNTSVIFVVFKYKDMRTVTNIYIANLSITDIAFLLICTSTTAVIYAKPDVIFSDFICRTSVYMQFVTVQATCGTLTVMTVDRYFLIVHAVKSRNTRKSGTAFLASAMVWLGSFLLHIPTLVFSKGDAKGCYFRFPGMGELIYNTYAVAMMYLAPLYIILVCYALILRQVWRRTSAGTESAQAMERSIRRRKKITRMVFIVVILFAICWGPLHVLNFIRWYKNNYVEDLHLVNFRVFCLCLAYANSCVNPFIYAFATNSFKKSFKKMFAGSSCCGREHDSYQIPNGGNATGSTKIEKSRGEDSMSI